MLFGFELTVSIDFLLNLWLILQWQLHHAASHSMFYCHICEMETVISLKTVFFLSSQWHITPISPQTHAPRQFSLHFIDLCKLFAKSLHAKLFANIHISSACIIYVQIQRCTERHSTGLAESSRRQLWVSLREKPSWKKTLLIIFRVDQSLMNTAAEVAN